MMKTYVGNIYCFDGIHMLTAVDGGGLGGPNDAGVALHTDQTNPGPWETFKLILQPGSPPIGPGMVFALQTWDGNYLTAINGGGVGGPNNATCPIHTDQTKAHAGLWEQFSLNVNNTTNPPTVTIQTENGHYLTAVDGGGVDGGDTQPIHSDATSVEQWEQFTFQLLAGVAS
jgi:hypothetical protein